MYLPASVFVAKIILYSRRYTGPQSIASRKGLALILEFHFEWSVPTRTHSHETPVFRTWICRNLVFPRCDKPLREVPMKPMHFDRSNNQPSRVVLNTLFYEPSKPVKHGIHTYVSSVFNQTAAKYLCFLNSGHLQRKVMCELLEWSTSVCQVSIRQRLTTWSCWPSQNILPSKPFCAVKVAAYSPFLKFGKSSSALGNLQYLHSNRFSQLILFVQNKVM